MNRNLFVLAAAMMVAGVNAGTLDGIAAKVDDAVITVGDVMREMQRAGRPDAAGFRAAYSNALEEAIERRLILNAAAARKLDMQEWLVDNRVRDIVNDNFGGDMNKLNAALAESKTPITEWRNRLRDDMIVHAMRFQMVDKYSEPSPSAMQNEYTFHRDRYCAEAKVTVSVILLRPPRSKDDPAVAKLAEDVLARLKKGEKFAELAKKFSADSHAKDGGVWKDVKPEEAFRPEIAATIAKLKVGEHSQLVNLDGWGFIVRKDAESKTKQLTFDEAYDEVARNLRRANCAKRYAEWADAMKAQAFIERFPIPDDK